MIRAKVMPDLIAENAKGYLYVTMAGISALANSYEDREENWIPA
jgi:hypothetical protein